MTLLGVVCVVASSTPAAAHPFGPPLQARMELDGSQVVLSWTGAEDDWVALGDHTGAFEESTGSGRTGSQVLASSTAVRDYLADRIAVAHAGAPCPQQALEVRDLLAEGARFAFDCPDGASEVSVTLEVLTDVNEAYRTVLSTDAGTPDQLLFTATQPTHDIQLGAGAAQSSTALLTGGGLLAVLAAGAALFARRRKAHR